MCLGETHAEFYAQFYSINTLLNKAWFPLVVRIGDFYDLPTSGFLITSVNTPSQTVGDFYDVIGRIRSISTFEGISQTVSDIGHFYDECEHEICLSGTVPMIGDFYDEHQICLSGTSGMLDFVFTCYQRLIFSEL